MQTSYTQTADDRSIEKDQSSKSSSEDKISSEPGIEPTDKDEKPSTEEDKTK